MGLQLNAILPLLGLDLAVSVWLPSIRSDLYFSSPGLQGKSCCWWGWFAVAFLEDLLIQTSRELIGKQVRG